MTPYQVYSDYQVIEYDQYFWNCIIIVEVTSEFDLVRQTVLRSNARGINLEPPQCNQDSINTYSFGKTDPRFKNVIEIWTYY